MTPTDRVKEKSRRIKSKPIARKTSSLECDICKEVVSTQRQLVVHHNRFHSDNKKSNLTCDLCNSSFALQSLLQSHIQSVHHVQPDFSCEKCNFVSKRNAINPTNHVR